MSIREIWNTQQLSKAVEFATIAHMGQVRKYTGQPYIMHPIEVAKMVADFGGTTQMVIAAYLHDTIEDCEGVTYKVIELNFGESVAKLVQGLTKGEYPNRTRAERCGLERERLGKLNAPIQTIKFCDIICNCNDIIQYDLTFGQQYLHEKLELVDDLNNGDLYLQNLATATIKAELRKAEIMEKGQKD
jgi:(p)ppGpp synthase/HD superfamily hydrolase